MLYNIIMCLFPLTVCVLLRRDRGAGERGGADDLYYRDLRGPNSTINETQVSFYPSPNAPLWNNRFIFIGGAVCVNKRHDRF